jgi:TolA-binding protein
VYPDPRVADFITERFVPVRVHVKDQRDEYQRLAGQYSAQWTPTVLIIDQDGAEHHRIEGFLPAEDFLGQLTLGTARAAFKRGDYATAERSYGDVVERFPNTEAAPEALYWAGVAKYRATNDPAALKETARAFSERFQSSSWAKKASVWS